MRFALLVLVLLLSAFESGAQALQVGVGKRVITPATDMWMSGYASRNAPSSGKIHDLWAKALAFQDASGARTVILTTDLIGIPAPLAKQTVDLVQSRLGIPRDRVMLTSSHTHCGPVLRDNLDVMYELDDEQQRLRREYSDALPELFLGAIEDAVSDLEPGRVLWGIGRADFARNRRGYTTDGVALTYNAIGPVDFDVPTLVAERADGTKKAVLFGYACHNTTLAFYQICGDYAGFAQIYIEQQLPGTTALFVSGCGADQNPIPRQTLTLAMTYGESLGKAVIAAMNGSLAPVEGPVRATYEEIPLALSVAPSRADLERQLGDENVYIQRRARQLLQTLDEKGAIPETYPYPIQVWQFADDLQITALGGEVVVDYSLRMKTEFDRDRQFVIGYANDVMAYIPSLRILREGGYEGEGAMVYYGLHGPWAPTVERDIFAAIHRLAARPELINLTDANAIAARRPLLIAHRGGVVTDAIPECSAAAIEAASSAGYDLVELDIQESKDHEPIVFHDQTLDEDCGVAGSISDRTAAELTAIVYRTNDEPIQHLEDALRICQRERLGVMLDIKSGESTQFFDRIIGLLERFELTNATMCINGAEVIRKHFTGHILLTATETSSENAPKSFWFGLPADLPDERVRDLQHQGKLVIPAINTFRYESDTHLADAQADIERLTAAGVDGFQIDSVYQHLFNRPLTR